ncbi:TIGR02186 family protein [Alterisphingorhabdus coralli]|uniref:TIGR02186 family protein n=1 Tax=Alterisphingorhabdus coralli TaxID=3071408 RepID=A0AA97F7G2_9SPHN|nr:TIGR02186 family protein [Parasphingorhabdus sp. SCSIO 66989]WOE75581.1 TIGR02186 family protein [Parasphingorhabdus sp. SCSIO 66989]
MTLAHRILLALAGLLLLTAADEPVLVPDVSEREINIRYGFTGAELLLFGAISYPNAARPPDAETDIVVVLRGPPQAIIVREKQKIAGIWVNAASTEFRSAPSFYAIAASRPLEDIVDDRTALIYEFGLDKLQLSPGGTIDPEEQRRFIDGLVDLNTRNQLFDERNNGVTIEKGLLYQARLEIPSTVVEGTYEAETFLVQDGVVVAAEIREIEIGKVGFERAVGVVAEDYSWAYGLAAVIISLLFGWAAGLIFQRI